MVNAAAHLLGTDNTDDLGTNYLPHSSKKELIVHLNSFLLSEAHIKPTVIIIDDAQSMSVEAMEDLRLLSNLETDKEKLLQIVLVGQPELEDLISRREMRQLKQRISIKCRLENLTREEIAGYISRRLFIAGDKGSIRFTRGAMEQVYRKSNGIPRLINKICNYALMAGYVSNNFSIEQPHIKKALSEVGMLTFLLKE